MNKIFRICSMICACTGLLSCTAKSQFTTAAGNKSLLWEVTGNGLQKPTYLYGTMHLLCAEEAALSTNLQTIIRESDEVYFEIDLDDLSQILSGFTLGRMKADTTLDMLYAEEDYQRVKDFFVSNGMELQFTLFKRMQPMLISALVYEVAMPCTQKEGIELNIMQLAKKFEKEVKGLETAAYQASLMENIPYVQQAVTLLNSIDSISTMETQAREMARLYREQDLEKLLEFSLETEGGTSKEIEDIIINQRNRNWAEMFGRIAGNKQLLIAVGAGHLGGDNGLIILLQQKGYTLRPLEN